MAPAIDRRRAPHTDLGDALRAAAIELVAEHGAGSVTLREVARRAGVSPAAPYRHFPDKDALLAAVAEDLYRALHERMEEASRVAPPAPEEQLTAQAIAYLRFGIERPAHMRAIFRLAADRARHPELSREDEATFTAVLDKIRAAQASGGITSAEEPLVVTLATWAMIHGLTMLLIDGHLPAAGGSARAPEELLRRSLRLFRGGPAAGTEKNRKRRKAPRET